MNRVSNASLCRKFVFSPVYFNIAVCKNSTHGRDEKYVQNFGWEVQREETTRET